MFDAQRSGPRQATHRVFGLVAVLILGGNVVAGCTSLERNPSGAITVTVKPGDTGQCAIAPCRILLQMPPGDGEYRVTGNEITLGTYPAGKTVDLGNYYEPQAIEIVGAGVPRAFVYLPVLP
ncbi:hypothetical protein [uncultured Thiohalocapsa sp.]|uniref:hypothetical protein n=1 Tax=uncultured Thiohalocapsa sp. TaxID=768990 RepID=UPI0025DE8BB0|nr:hypothetical protein [uncultured Thiohalocapsa sp.]